MLEPKDPIRPRWGAKKRKRFWLPPPKSFVGYVGKPFSQHMWRPEMSEKLDGYKILKNAEKRVFTCKDRCRYSRKRAIFSQKFGNHPIPPRARARSPGANIGPGHTLSEPRRGG